MKKLLAVAIMILFISVSVIPSTGINVVKQITMPTAKGDTLYVGGNGTGNYTSIQGAIDDASDGDTVFVYDDSSPYYEHVVVDKSINLVGEDRDTTVIDGNGIANVISIIEDNVSISKFTIQNSGTNAYDAGILLQIITQYLTLLLKITTVAFILLVLLTILFMVTQSKIISHMDLGL